MISGENSMLIKKIIKTLLPHYLFQRVLMRMRGRLIDISKLVKHFEGQDVFAFGTGISVDYLENQRQLEKHNLMLVTTGPLHFYRMYGVMPNIWMVHNSESIEMFLNEYEKGELDFSNTFIFVPGNFSTSKITFDSKIVRKLRSVFPEATYVLYKEAPLAKKTDFESSALFKKSHQPIYRIDGSTLENIFIPICAYLGIRSVYFSGVDHIDHAGHFWDSSIGYQTIHGEHISFSKTQKKILFIGNETAKALKKQEMSVFRSGVDDTILTMYPYKDFSQHCKGASSRIISKDIN